MAFIKPYDLCENVELNTNKLISFYIAPDETLEVFVIVRCNFALYFVLSLKSSSVNSNRVVRTANAEITVSDDKKLYDQTG